MIALDTNGLFALCLAFVFVSILALAVGVIEWVTKRRITAHLKKMANIETDRLRRLRNGGNHAER